MIASPPGKSPDAEVLLGALRDLLGAVGVLTEPSDIARYATDWRGLFTGRPLAVIRPADTTEVAAAVRLCAAARAPIVPQGGNTSMVGGATPSDDGREVVLSLERMRRVRDLDAVDHTMIVEAGVTLQDAQEAAAAAGLLLPLSINSEGSARIGGVLATNAGGNNTLRHGNARELVLGLEVVLADGAVWNGLRRLRKDNTGYCLRQLFVGSEGTLGIITAAALQLQPGLVSHAAALCALPTVESCLALLGRLRRRHWAELQAFEYMSGAAAALVPLAFPEITLPLAASPHYVLVDLGASETFDLEAALEAVLAEAMEAAEVSDAVLSRSDGQRKALWRIREEHSEAQKRAGASIKNDVSVPISAIPELLRAAKAACEALLPGVRTVPFGHLGDGNIHLNLLQPEGMAAADFTARTHELADCVNAVVHRLGGSFSAEHGVGRLKTGMMAEWRGGPELAMMRAIKSALDPAGLFSPQVLLPPQDPDAEAARTLRDA
jgi:FAD/FMN-containing dehydrogenase